MKKNFILLLVAVLLVSAFPAASFAAGLMPEGIVPELPLVSEPTTIKIGVPADAFSDYEGGVIWDQFQEETGITIDWVEYAEEEQVTLMYASREYPDVIINLGTDQAKADAIAAGDIIALDEYKDLLPNVYAFFDLYPNIAQKAFATDGHLYGTPYAFLDEVSYGLRDVWLINRTWLDELGLAIPTTATEYLDVLRAFKAHAGEGSIPENVIPHYMRYNERIGGQFDIYCAFGVYMMDGDYSANIDGKYTYQAVNPDLKDAIKYLKTMYAEGLLPASMFTDDSSTYYNVVNSIPAIAGVVTGYHNGNNYTIGGNYYPIAPFDSETGRPSYTRTQNPEIKIKNCIMVTKACTNVEAAIKFIDYLNVPINSMRAQWGAEGCAWKYNDDGDPELIESWVRDLEQNVPYNGVEKTLITSDWYVNPSKNLEGHRAWAVFNTYKDTRVYYTMPNMPNDVLDEMDELRINDLGAPNKDYVKKTVADWIMGNGDIDSEWDAFVKKQYDLGLDEYLELCQLKLDTFMGVK